MLGVRCSLVVLAVAVLGGCGRAKAGGDDGPQSRTDAGTQPYDRDGAAPVEPMPVDAGAQHCESCLIYSRGLATGDASLGNEADLHVVLFNDLSHLQDIPISPVGDAVTMVALDEDRERIAFAHQSPGGPTKISIVRLNGDFAAQATVVLSSGNDFVRQLEWLSSTQLVFFVAQDAMADERSVFTMNVPSKVPEGAAIEPLLLTRAYSLDVLPASRGAVVKTPSGSPDQCQLQFVRVGAEVSLLPFLEGNCSTNQVTSWSTDGAFVALNELGGADQTVSLFDVSSASRVPMEFANGTHTWFKWAPTGSAFGYQVIEQYPVGDTAEEDYGVAAGDARVGTLKAASEWTHGRLLGFLDANFFLVDLSTDDSVDFDARSLLRASVADDSVVAVSEPLAAGQFVVESGRLLVVTDQSIDVVNTSDHRGQRRAISHRLEPSEVIVTPAGSCVASPSCAATNEYISPDGRVLKYMTEDPSLAKPSDHQSLYFTELDQPAAWAAPVPDVPGGLDAVWAPDGRGAIVYKFDNSYSVNSPVSYVDFASHETTTLTSDAVEIWFPR